MNKQQAAEVRLNWVRKRLPGRKPIDDLERIAILLDMDGNDEDAAILRALAARLRDLRCFFRGEGRRERDERLTREALALATADEQRPFEEEE